MTSLRLPCTIQRGAELQAWLRTMLMLAGGAFGLAIVVSLLTQPLGSAIGSALAGALAGGAVCWVIAKFLIKALEPAAITVGGAMVEIVPVAIFGITSDRPIERYPVSAFRKVEVSISRFVGPSPKIPHCAFIARDRSARDVRFFPPGGLTAAGTATQLNQLLGYTH